MHKNKVKGLIGILLCIIGFLFILLSLMLVHFDLTIYNKDGQYVKKEKRFHLENIEQIVIDVQTEDIIMKPSSDSKLHIIYYENQKTNQYYIEDIQDTIFQFKRKGSYIGFQFNPFRYFQNEKQDITILVPLEYMNKISLKTTSGLVQSSHLYTQNLSITTVTGDIHLNDIKADTVAIESTSGNILFSNLKLENAKFHTVSGSVKGNVLDKKDAYTILIKMIAGTSNLREQKGITSKKLEFDTTNGTVKVTFLKD